MKKEFTDQLHYLRKKIRAIGIDVRCLEKHSNFKEKEAFDGQYEEIKANIMLAFRHIEDARMRLGKVIQQIIEGTYFTDFPPEERQKILDRFT